jgi:peptidoglycan/LPS O-acetylase OafA/YrhL
LTSQIEVQSQSAHAPNPSRLAGVDVFRGFAITTIVFGHSMKLISGRLPENAISLYVISAIAENGTSFFVFISGFLFVPTSRTSLVKYLQRKFAHVLLPFAVVSIIALFFQPNQFMFVDVVNPIKWTEVNPPTWYILMITYYYLAMPVFTVIGKYLTLKSPWCCYILGLFLLLSLATPRPIDDIQSSATHFLFAYILGIFVYNEQIFISKLVFRHKKYLILLVLFIFISTIPINLLSGRVTGFRNFQISSVTKAISSVLFLIYIPLTLEALRNYQLTWIAKSIQNIFTTLARYSFGIFFIHYFVIAKISELLPVQDLLSWFLIGSFLSLFVSLWIVAATKSLLNLFGVKETHYFIGC